jgi:hypothetical protein
MENEIIETRVSKIWLGEDGILRTTFIPDAELTLEDAIEIFHASKKVTGGKKAVSLVDARNVKSATSEVRKYGAREETVIYRAAIAVLVSSSITRALGNIFMRLNKPPYPSRLFTTEAEAMEWLKDFLD